MIEWGYRLLVLVVVYGVSMPLAHGWAGQSWTGACVTATVLSALLIAMPVVTARRSDRQVSRRP